MYAKEISAFLAAVRGEAAWPYSVPTAPRSCAAPWPRRSSACSPAGPSRSTRTASPPRCPTPTPCPAHPDDQWSPCCEDRRSSPHHGDTVEPRSGQPGEAGVGHRPAQRRLHRSGVLGRADRGEDGRAPRPDNSSTCSSLVREGRIERATGEEPPVEHQLGEEGNAGLRLLHETQVATAARCRGSAPPARPPRPQPASRPAPPRRPPSGACPPSGPGACAGWRAPPSARSARSSRCC